jgi:DNA-binding GntR family transcriptional regulator
LTAKLQLSAKIGLSRTAQANVTEFLKNAILSGELPAGTRLVQAELSEALNVSVTPIREALRELSTQGLVDLDAFRGAVVHTPTITELEEIFEVRAVLLPLSVQKGIYQITQQELDRAASLIEQMERETNQTRWIELNRQFHGLLYDANKNSKLKEVLQQLSDIASVYINLQFSDRPLQKDSADREHRMLLEAYRAKNIEQATEITLSHINSTLEAARQALQK